MEDPLAVARVGGSFKPSLGRDDVRAPVAIDVSCADAVPVALRADDVSNPVRVLSLTFNFIPGQWVFGVAELRQKLSRLAGVQDVHQKRKFHRRALHDFVLHPGLVGFAGVFPPVERRGPVGTGHNVGVAVTVHVNCQVAQVFHVAADEAQVAKMVLDPTRPILARRRLLVPVLAGNDVEPPILIHVGDLRRFALSQVNGVLIERNLLGTLSADAPRHPKEAGYEGKNSGRKSNNGAGPVEDSNQSAGKGRHGNLLKVINPHGG